MSASEYQGAVKPSAGRIAVLDGYRALAIMAVLAFHFTVRWAPPNDPLAHLPEGRMFNGVAALHQGAAGVEFFFVISGFVILMTLERCRSLGDFVVRRFARLWPGLLVAATLTTIVLSLIGPADWRVGADDFVASIFLADPDTLNNLFDNNSLRWVDGAYWSLWVEVRFYVLAAAVYLVARGYFLETWLVLDTAVFFAAQWLTAGSEHALLELAFFPKYLPYFTLGMLMYRLDSGTGSRPFLTVATIAAAAMILYNAKAPHLTGFFIVNVLIILLFALFVARTRIVRIFSYRPIVAIGAASYSLYLIHQLIGVTIMRQLIDLGVPYLLAFAVVTGGLVAAALLLARYVEGPAKVWIIARSKGWIGAMDRRMPWLRYDRPEGMAARRVERKPATPLP